MKLKVEIEYSGAEAKKVMAMIFGRGVAVKEAVVEKAKRKVGRPKKIVKPPRVHRMSGESARVVARRKNILTLLDRSGQMTSSTIAEVMGEPKANILYDLYHLRKLKRVVKHNKMYMIPGFTPAVITKAAGMPKIHKHFVRHFKSGEMAETAICDFVKWGANKKVITSTDFMQFCFGMPISEMTDAWVWLCANMPKILDHLQLEHDKVKVTTVDIKW